MDAVIRIVFLAAVGGLIGFIGNRFGVPLYLTIPIAVGVAWFGSDLLRKLKS
jgi:small basic protein